MVDDRLKSIGLTGRLLAKLTGQTPGAVSEKINRRADRGYRLGAREAGVMACFTIMDDEQRAAVDAAFKRIMSDFEAE